MISQSTKNTIVVAGVIGLAAGIWLFVNRRQQRIMKGYMVSSRTPDGRFSIYMVDGTMPNSMVQEVIDTYKDTESKNNKLRRTDNYKYMAKLEDLKDVNTVKLSGQGLNGKYKRVKNWYWNDDKTGKSLYAMTLKDDDNNWDGDVSKFKDSGWKGRYMTRKPFIIKTS